ncbi:MAG: hypothetical protein PHS41_02525 [Victivallaceae bacterium]|nr:hypothetical protein [Victivallaceae bacterium]
MNNILWDFPGGAPGVFSAVIVLAGATIFFYLRTVRTLSLAQRILLIALRTGVLLLILGALINPRRETIRSHQERCRHKIAVWIDRSGSMSTPGFWKRSRLDDVRDFCEKNFLAKDPAREYHFFSFGETFRRADGPGAWREIAKTTEKTDFFALLAEEIPKLQQEQFSGLIVMTDGIDTTGRGSFDEARSALAATSVGVVFVPMTAELAAAPALELVKIESPVFAYTRTEIALNFMIRKTNLPKNSTTMLRLWADGRKIAEHSIPGGNTLRTVQERFAVEQVGMTTFQAELLLDGKIVASERWTLQKKTRKEESRILLYNGALEYGNRFLRNVFRDTPKIVIDLAFAPGIVNSKGKHEENISFDSTEELKKYDAVVLFNVNRAQMSTPMQQNLRQYLSDGGGLLFITGNPAIAGDYAHSALEKLLPVVFSDSIETDRRYDARTSGIVRLITSGHRPTNFDYDLQRNSEMRYKAHPLQPFVLTETGRASDLPPQRRRRQAALRQNGNCAEV